MSKKRTKANGEGSVYRRGDKWEAQVILGWMLPDDPSKPKTPLKARKGGFKTKKEASEYLSVLRQRRTGRPASVPNLAYYWQMYSDGELLNLSKSKQMAYKIAWNKLKSISHLKVDNITVQSLRDAVSSSCSSYYTAKDCKNLLSALFRLAAADGYAQRDLPSFIILPELKEAERDPFTEQEQRALWKLYESGNIDAAIPLFMIYTGSMPGEAMKLRTEQIDLEHQLIVGAGIKTKVRKKTPIVIADSIVPLVSDLIDHAQPNGFVWPQNEKGWYEKYYSALSASGCRRLTPYSCRHTTATALAVTENVAPQTIRKIMRWSSTKMLDRYAHPSTDDVLSGINTITPFASAGDMSPENH